MYLLEFLRIININLEDAYFVIVFIIVFYVFVEVEFIVSPFKTIKRQLLLHCPSGNTIDIQAYEVWEFFVGVIVFHVFVVWFCLPMHGTIHSTQDTFFYC